MTQALDSVLQQLRGHGLAIDALEVDGVVRRLDGERKGKKAAWYVAELLTLDNGDKAPIALWGEWHEIEHAIHRVKPKGVKLSEADKARQKTLFRDLTQLYMAFERQWAAENAARADETWDKLKPATASAWLQAHGSANTYGLRAGRNGVVVMPLSNVAGMISQLQFIYPDGETKFLTGPGLPGAFHLVGKIKPHQPVVLVPDFLSASLIWRSLSLRQTQPWPVAVCGTSENLLWVGQALRSRAPDQPLLVAGHDEHEAVGRDGSPLNAGRVAATLAANKLKAPVVFPEFLWPGGRATFADLYMETDAGAEFVADQLERAWSDVVEPAGRDPGATTPLAQDRDEDVPGWTRLLVYAERGGGIKPMVHNAMIVLEHHPEWEGVLAFNEFDKRVVLRKPGPYGTSRAGPITDADEIEIAAWFGRRDTYGVSISTSAIHEAVYAVANRFPFHPVRDYLNALEWDETPRIETFFSDFCNAPQNDVTAAFARCFFLSAVARIFRPGCKADLMLVLEGEQGARKSSLAQALSGPEWYVDVGASPNDKDFFQLIQGKWIVEISEMASFAKAETAHIKRAVSVAVDHFRAPYGRIPQAYPRECVFFGTVNDGDWQRDATGGRRYMPMWVADVNLDAVLGVRDQVWAEAVRRFRDGETWHDLPDEAREQQDLRYLEDIWAEPIWHWLEGNASQRKYPSDHVGKVKSCTTSDVLLKALDMDTKKQDRQAQMRVGAILRRLGWKREQRRQGNTRVYVYLRPDEE